VCLASYGLAELGENVQNRDSHLPTGESDEENKPGVYELDTAAVAVDRQEALSRELALYRSCTRGRCTAEQGAAVRAVAVLRQLTAVRLSSAAHCSTTSPLQEWNGYFGVCFG
jgi:hypothetical protein